MSGISNIGRSAAQMASKMPSKANVIAGGLTEGAIAHLNLKKMFDMYSQQMAWQEQYDMRKEAREHGRKKELTAMEQQGAMEKTVAGTYGVKPVGFYTPEGQPINTPTVSRDFPANAQKVSPLTYFPGYGIDTTGSQSSLPEETVPGWYSVKQGGKTRFLRKPETYSQDYRNDLVKAVSVIRSNPKYREDVKNELVNAYPKEKANIEQILDSL